MTPTDLQALLAERAWLRRLAVALTRDPAVADDLTQDAYVVAMERAPARVQAPRAWLGTVLRNLARNRARSERRLQARLAAAPARAASEPPDALLARAEIIEQVAQAVLRLSEPQRTTVLLRFFEDLPPRRVAAQMNVPVATVRTRLRRALQALAVEMDAEHQGERERWAAPLAAWSASASTAIGGVLAGGLVMKKAVAIGVLLVGALLLGWQVVPRGNDGDGDASPPEAPSTALVDPMAEAVPDPTLEGAAGPGTAEEGERPSAPAPESEDGIVVEGLVFHADGRPASATRIEGWSLTRTIGTVMTDETGRYRLPIGEHPEALNERVVVHATGPGGTAGMVDLGLWRGMRTEARAHPIVLRAATSIRIRVEHDDEPVPGARVVVSGLYLRSWDGHLELETDAQGAVQVERLVAGTYRIDASHPDRGRGTRVCTLPPDAREVAVVTLRPALRTLDVLVVESGTTNPVAGARVEVYEALGPARLGERGPYFPAPVVPPTDAEGRTRIEGLDATARLVVVASVEGRPPPSPRWLTSYGGMNLRPPEEVASDAEAVTIEVPRKVEVAWPIADGEVPVPEDGTVVEIVPLDASPAVERVPGRIEGGRLIAEVFPDVGMRSLAVTPDGARAYVWLTLGQDEGEEITFWRPRRAEVVLRLADGRPAAGVGVQIGSTPSGLHPVATTDASGKAVFEDLPKLSGYAVHLVPPFASFALGGRTPLGRPACDEDGVARLEATVGPEREVSVQFRVAGEPFLPGDLTLRRGAAAVVHVTRDPERAEVRFRVRSLRPGSHHYFQVTARGYARTQFRVPADGEATLVEREVELVPTGSLFVRILAPPDRVSGVQVHRWVSESATWAHGATRKDRENKLPDVTIWTGLRNGRHRVVDTLSGVATEPFEVDVAAGPETKEIDLRDVVEVSGHVAVPPEHKPGEARLVVEGRPPSLHEMPIPGLGGAPPLRIGRDGAFTFRMPRDATETLRLWHPRLQSEGGERVVVRASDAPLRIRFVEGTQATIRFHEDTRPAMPEGNRQPPVLVHLYVNRPDGKPRHTYELKAWGDEVNFGGYVAGTYTVWVSAHPYEPVQLDRVELGEGHTDLGTLRLEIGGSIRLRLLVDPDEPAPPFQISAWAQEEPTYWRTTRITKGTEAVLTGLRPGRYRIRGMLNTGGRTILDEQIHVRDDTEILREVDLR